MTRLRVDFVEEQSRWINRMRGLVNQIYPELEVVFKRITFTNQSGNSAPFSVTAGAGYSFAG